MNVSPCNYWVYLKQKSFPIVLVEKVKRNLKKWRIIICNGVTVLEKIKNRQCVSNTLVNLVHVWWKLFHFLQPFSYDSCTDSQGYPSSLSRKSWFRRHTLGTSASASIHWPWYLSNWRKIFLYINKKKYHNSFPQNEIFLHITSIKY